MDAIHIDLRNLTQAHVDEVLPYMGECSYASPCIIGTLVPKEHREYLDKCREASGSPELTVLVNSGKVTVQDGQLGEATHLQDTFDGSADPAEFLLEVQKWIDAEPPESPE